MRDMMNRVFVSVTLAGSLLMATPLCADQRNIDAAIGGALGGGFGALLGNELGGRNGAMLGGALGAAAGAAVTTDSGYSERRDDDQRDDRRWRSGFCPPGQAKTRPLADCLNFT